ncbi:hypothetical protein [Sphingobacterium sp. BS-2]|uniref:hypothetical protein n=1 Tax=Sphingobacterium sp. BS-2 TaxID=3377129 RepID=UPI0038FCC3C8
MILQELKMGEALTYVTVNGGTPDIVYHYVSIEGRVVGVGAFSNRRGFFIAAQVFSGDGQETLLTHPEIAEEELYALDALEHLFSVYFRNTGSGSVKRT